MKNLLFLLFSCISIYGYSQDDFPKELLNLDLVGIPSEQESPIDTIRLNKLLKEFKKLNIEPSVIQSIVDKDNVWSTPGIIIKYELKVCFHLLKADFIYFEKRLKTISNYANEWSKYGNVSFIFDLKNPCDLSHLNQYQVKIAQNKGNFFWSTVGKYSKSNPTSMNLPNLTTTSDTPKFRRQVIHEFGHVLGLVHEHFHPDFSCDLDFDRIRSIENWPTVEDAIKNYKPILDSRAFDINTYDSMSIMHYAIRQEFIKQGSSCSNLPAENLDISPGDAAAILGKYPRNGSEFVSVLKTEKDKLDQALALLEPFFKDNVELWEYQQKGIAKSKTLEFKKNVFIDKNNKIDLEKK